jgi:hypothetical protein
MGSPPFPFEHPNEKMDFLVLELGIHDDEEGWCARTIATLNAHADVLRQMQRAGAKATLFVESGSREPALRFAPSFLSVLSEAGITLECSHV